MTAEEEIARRKLEERRGADSQAAADGGEALDEVWAASANAREAIAALENAVLRHRPGGGPARRPPGNATTSRAAHNIREQVSILEWAAAGNANYAAQMRAERDQALRETAGNGGSPHSCARWESRAIRAWWVISRLKEIVGLDDGAGNNKLIDEVRGIAGNSDSAPGEWEERARRAWAVIGELKEAVGLDARAGNDELVAEVRNRWAPDGGAA